MNKSQRGFALPFISAIIGFIVSVAGAIFPAFLPKIKQNAAPIGEVTTSTPIQTSSSVTPASTQKSNAPVSPRRVIPSVSGGASSLQVAASTSTPPIQAPVPVNPYKDSLSAIDAFLANPTVASLKDFCTKAKQLPGKGTQSGLDSSRTTLVSTTNTLYEDITWCELVLSEDTQSHYTWVSYDPSLLISLTNPNDTDAIRTYKIKLNGTLQTLGQYGLIGYDSSIAGGTDVHQDKLPQQVIDALLGRSGTSRDMLLRLFASSIISPVEELTNMRQQYFPN